MTNVTVAGNTSAGGGGLGAGVFLEAGTGTREQHGIAGNMNGSGIARDCAFGSEFAMVVSNGGNVAPGGDCFAGGGDFTGDPLFGPLQDNGGPTDTRALGTGSAAIDAAPGLVVRHTDQRGIARPQGAACDRGAYEDGPLDGRRRRRRRRPARRRCSARRSTSRRCRGGC